jgi:hypothetical protein
MSEIYAHIELAMLIIGSLCSAFLLARLVLLAYDDLRQTWKKNTNARRSQGLKQLLFGG